ncbi:Phosphoserine phosphatase rsbU [Cesiribacter andamanensis AMV16]|uniref:Phosphoserine phosphatase rsbU n=1 Tax=Cesiribacter andamanensis AMV16 TaxID=1279009 RepID=M7NZ04_9BACT|nr:Phosphoserine phosphatase rsbU [Cesiribacter andamanensis AMV16]
MYRYTLLFFFLLPGFMALSQSRQFVLEGTVHGYEYEASRGFLKKSKPPFFEGTLEGATLSLELNGDVLEERFTDEKGTYTLSLEFNQLYTLAISKPGYNVITLLVDTRAFPKEIQQGGYRFLGAEFVLNSFKKGADPDLNRTLGRLHYNPSKRQFNLARIDSRSGPVQQGADGADAGIELMERAISRNSERIDAYAPEAASGPGQASTARGAGTPPQARTPLADSLREPQPSPRSALSSDPYLGPALGRDISDTSLLSTKEEALSRAREQLAMDKLRQQTKEDSLVLLKREAQILAAEQEIQNARLLIKTQEETLRAQQNSLLLLILLLVVLTLFSILVYFFYRNKQRTSLLLEQKNQQITDSISYAQRIQQSILVGERTLKTYLCDSFVLSEPRDIVSGDFYFFHPHARGYVVAVADCTGHGVPGAFMSLIGHRLLREIVAEQSITDPAQILDRLNKAVQQTLQGEKEGDILQDGMDISVCYIEPEKHSITFAAAMNPAYLVQEQHLQVLQADINSIGGKILRSGRTRSFTNKAIAYAPGSMLYLFTDGFMDQFGEETDQKFNTRRFKDMILSLQHLPAEEQKHQAYTLLKTGRAAYARPMIFCSWAFACPRPGAVLCLLSKGSQWSPASLLTMKRPPLQREGLRCFPSPDPSFPSAHHPGYSSIRSAPACRVGGAAPPAPAAG